MSSLNELNLMHFTIANVSRNQFSATQSGKTNIFFLDANQFIKGMDQFVDVIEREKHVFNVEVKDPGAPVDFFINGKKVSKTDERCEYVNLGEGKHQLIIHHINMEDLGTIEAKTPSNRGDQVLTSSTAFDVTKGEEAPEIGATGPVTGIAYKDCSWKVPYKVS